jgi:outer membrane protein TolC
VTSFRPYLSHAFAVLVLSVLCAPGAFAQTPAMPTVEFDTAVQQAVAKNPTLAGAATSIARADALLQQARAALMPVVSASVTSVTYNAERGFEDTVTQPRSQVLFGANASMPLLAPEARARVIQGRDQVDVATLATAEVRQQVAVAAAYAYLGVVAARRQVEVNERAVESARAHLDFAQKRLEGGAGSRLNQLRAAQALSRDEAQFENAVFALRQSQEALGLLLAEDGPVNAGADPTFDVPATADGQTGWLIDRPDVQLQNRTIEAAERVLRDSWKVWLPTASVAFVPQAVAPSSALAPAASWQISLNLSQRLFDRRPAAEKALRQVALSQATFVLDDLELRARSEERVARQALISSERVLAASRRAALQADEVLTITTAAFEVGATTNLEVIDAQLSARDAATAAAFAEDAARRARFELLVALGRFK